MKYIDEIALLGLMDRGRDPHVAIARYVLRWRQGGVDITEALPYVGHRFHARKIRNFIRNGIGESLKLILQQLAEVLFAGGNLVVSRSHTDERLGKKGKGFLCVSLRQITVKETIDHFVQRIVRICHTGPPSLACHPPRPCQGTRRPLPQSIQALYVLVLL